MIRSTNEGEASTSWQQRRGACRKGLFKPPCSFPVSQCGEG